jgi:hypothetical protein
MFSAARKLAAMVVMGTALLVAAVSGVIATNKQIPLRPDSVDLPERLRPGSPLPSGAHCDWQPTGDDMLYCNVYMEYGLAYLAYDIERKQIIGTAASAGGKTIGDLILAWGIPTGFVKWSLSVQVYWGTRSAYIISNEFGPSSHASYISYTLEAQKTAPWKGFTNSPDN